MFALPLKSLSQAATASPVRMRNQAMKRLGGTDLINDQRWGRGVFVNDLGGPEEHRAREQELPRRIRSGPELRARMRTTTGTMTPTRIMAVRHAHKRPESVPSHHFRRSNP